MKTITIVASIPIANLLGTGKCIGCKSNCKLILNYVTSKRQDRVHFKENRLSQLKALKEYVMSYLNSIGERRMDLQFIIGI